MSSYTKKRRHFGRTQVYDNSTRSWVYVDTLPYADRVAASSLPSESDYSGGGGGFDGGGASGGGGGCE
jgi:uncharacterized membrane protein